MKINEVEQRLSAAFPDGLIQVNSHDGVHFEIVIIDDIFQGETRLARQRKVYESLGALIQSGELHALALKTFTKAEWNKKETK